jgi:hypothetical protein
MRYNRPAPGSNVNMCHRPSRLDSHTIVLVHEASSGARPPFNWEDGREVPRSLNEETPMRRTCGRGHARSGPPGGRS